MKSWALRRSFTPGDQAASDALVAKWRGPAYSSRSNAPARRMTYTNEGLLGVMANFLVLSGQVGRFNRWLK